VIQTTIPLTIKITNKLTLIEHKFRRNRCLRTV